jgi:hypothetical protein
MPTREAWIKRKIESLEDQRDSINNVIGDLRRELMTLNGQPVNDQQNYGGNIEPKSLNCAPISDSDREKIKRIYVDPLAGAGKPIFDPFLEGEIKP